MIGKPYKFFFLLIPIFIISGILGLEKSVSVSFLSFYLVLKVSNWCFLSAIFVSLIGVNYYLIKWANKKPIKLLTIIHIILQVIATIPFLISLFIISKTGNSYESTINYNAILFLSFIVFLVSIAIHIINFLISLFQKFE